MKNILFFLLFSSIIMSQSNKEICVTIDDLPFQQNGTTSTEMQSYYTQKLLKKLSAEKISAIGFVNENKLETDGKINPAKLELLKLWLESGMELGNHTYSHKGLHNSTVSEFEADILKGETQIKPMIKKAGGQLRYFRHPYLHTGRSLEIKDSVNNFLRENGYKIAPVTIDNSEWIYAFSYQKALLAGDSLLMKIRLGFMRSNPRNFSEEILNIFYSFILMHSMLIILIFFYRKLKKRDIISFRLKKH